MSGGPLGFGVLPPRGILVVTIYTSEFPATQPLENEAVKEWYEDMLSWEGVPWRLHDVEHRGGRPGEYDIERYGGYEIIEFTPETTPVTVEDVLNLKDTVARWLKRFYIPVSIEHLDLSVR